MLEDHAWSPSQEKIRDRKLIMDKTPEEKISLFIPTFEVDACLDEIRECLEMGWTGAGFKTVEFENSWSEYSKSYRSLFLNSNTAGLEIAIQTLKKIHNWSNQSEIITTALTFVSTNHAILRNQLTPKFCDIDESFCMDPNEIEKCLTKDTVAVLFVGMGGNTGQLLKIAEICRRNNLKLILDAAHMAGTKYIDSTPFTEFADIVVYSFQAVKNLPTADSGMLCTDNEEIYLMAKKISWLGIDTSTYERSAKNNSYKWMYQVDEIGQKANGNSIMASIGIVQLKVLDRDNLRRREIAEIYRQHLSTNSLISFPKIYEKIESSQHLFQIRVPQILRDDLIRNLNNQHIDVGLHYRLSTNYPMYSQYSKNLPKSKIIESEIISLPIHLRLKVDDIEKVCKVIIKELLS